MIRPPVLQPGSRVSLVAPAGPVSPHKIETALARCAHFGFEPVLGPNAAARRHYLAGPDEARAADLQSAIDDDAIDAIWAIRGGYGTVRILRQLDFARLQTRPKAFIGFSDNTTIHLALARAGLVSFHGPHAGAAFPPLTEECFVRVLMHSGPAGILPSLPHPDAETRRRGDAATTDRTSSSPTDADAPSAMALRSGTAEGVLAGGNLALLAAACGTDNTPQWGGRIAMIEDVGEPVYRIDRMLMQLLHAGAFEGVVAMGFGRFTETDPPGDDAVLHELLQELAARLGVPAVTGLPFGHVDDNWTLPFGVRARLDADAGTLEILESAGTPARGDAA